MKNKIIIILIFLSLQSISCKKFLELTPKDFISPENYFTSEASLNTALTGVYDILGRSELYSNTYMTIFSISDEGYYARSAQSTGPQVYNYSSADPNVNDLWDALYQGIERANVLLANVDKVNMDQDKKNNIIGQAKFLRAYYYFFLVQNWGSVPLKTSPSNSVNNVNTPGADIKTLYDFIVKEMTDAEPLVQPLATIGFGGRVSQDAVRGILARVCLKMAGQPLNDVSKYAEALKWAKAIVNPTSGSNIHSLNPDYANIFKNLAGDRYDIKECIWEGEQFGNRLTDYEGGRLGNVIGISCSDDVFGYSYGFINATPKLYRSYEAADKRRDWNVAPFSYKITGGVVVDSTFFTASQINSRNAGKYRRSYEKVLPRNKNVTPTNFPILRYSDVLLMYAEAENEVNGPTGLAKSLVKQVRDRANASDITTAVSDKDELRNIIKDERFREFPFECMRKNDLIRWGDFIIAMKEVANDPTMGSYAGTAGKNVSDRDILLPIPISELSLNKALTQNKGW
ncbi:RagB/SusD family nutrient uptake outer membrane protein [Pedobacter sp. SD-b]|uniref:RagB/SusD family nutrient uptake outer membrane protein n=1 Tax=Pedobacter segetis TaxID=2793069 RepID=A0ABS1BMQ3_9SPHI|nr:RagB/SusD family nutrient uptake outer membrane protein [Pedobacter segetis]MBK0384163.1 RagB/SusD family nutrient uptake outer membrane protein [Pedobacter segetis]